LMYFVPVSDWVLFNWSFCYRDSIPFVVVTMDLSCAASNAACHTHLNHC
jgi:hypothetical protein